MTDAIEKRQPAEVATQGGAAELIRMATEQGAGIEIIERMAALYERERADQRRQAYYQALARFQSACPSVERTDKAHNSKYAKLEHIVGTIKQSLKDCGLTYRYEIADEDGSTLAVTCVVTHTDGHSERTTMRAAPDTSGSKNAIQARGSALTYMQRYTLCGALGLVTVDEDNDGGAPQAAITADQAKHLRQLVEKAGFSIERQNAMLGYAGAESIEAIPVNAYQEICNVCLTEIRRQQEGQGEELPL